MKIYIDLMCHRYRDNQFLRISMRRIGSPDESERSITINNSENDSNAC